MQFTRFRIALLWICSSSSLVAADFSRGGGTCQAGIGAVEAVGYGEDSVGFLFGGGGRMSEGNYFLKIDNEELSENGVTMIPANQLLSIMIESKSLVFQEFLIRVDGGDSMFDTRDTLGPDPNSDITKVSTVCAKEEKVGGLTDNNEHQQQTLEGTFKYEASGEIMLPPDTRVNLQVTVVASARPPYLAEWYYSEFEVQSGPGATPTPSSSPSYSSAPVLRPSTSTSPSFSPSTSASPSSSATPTGFCAKEGHPCISSEDCCTLLCTGPVNTASRTCKVNNNESRVRLSGLLQRGSGGRQADLLLHQLPTVNQVNFGDRSGGQLRDAPLPKQSLSSLGGAGGERHV